MRQRALDESLAALEIADRMFEILDLVAIGAPVQRPRVPCAPEARRVARAARQQPRAAVVVAIEVTAAAAHPAQRRYAGRAAREEEPLSTLDARRQRAE